MRTPSLPLFISLIYLVEILLQPAHACMPWNKRKQQPKHKQRTCDCYVISGPDPGYFQHYQFWDFRNVPLPDGDEDENDDEDDGDGDGDGDDEAGGHESRGGRGRSSKNTQKAALLSDTPFSDDWHVQKWQRNGSQVYPVPMINAENNVFITRSSSGGKRRHASTHLVLRTMRFENFASTAEIESRIRDFMHCSLRVRFRIMGADENVLGPSTVHSTRQGLIDSPDDGAVASNFPLAAEANLETAPQPQQRRGKGRPPTRPPPSGACAGIFTYFSREVESDIEILTSDPPTRVRYANQPDWDPATDRMIPNASTIATIPVPWTVWATHRLDWHPTVSRWYVDGLVQDIKTYHVPDKPSMIALNLWSNGGEWTGDLKLGESVHMAIEWIEIAYNVSSSPSPAAAAAAANAALGGFDADDDDDGVFTAGSNDLPNTVMNVTQEKTAAAAIATPCHNPCNIDDRRRPKRSSDPIIPLFGSVRHP